MTQPRAKPHRLMWVGIVAAIVVVAGVAELIGIQRAHRTLLTHGHFDQPGRLPVAPMR